MTEAEIKQLNSLKHEQLNALIAFRNARKELKAVGYRADGMAMTLSGEAQAQASKVYQTLYRAEELLAEVARILDESL